jgi:hypothetical protein
MIQDQRLGIIQKNLACHPAESTEGTLHAVEPAVLPLMAIRADMQSPGIAERCDKQMDLYRNTADLHPAFTEVDLQLFAGLRLEPNCRTCRSNQLTPQRRNRAFHRTQTDTYTLLARQLLAHHIGIAGMATKTLAQPVR